MGDAMVRWRRVEQLFEAAMSRPPEERTPFLVRECGGDDALRVEVESLLPNTAQSPTFLDDDLGAVAARVFDDGGGNLTGRQLGVYVAGPLIGSGGMGHVYRAHDLRLARDVALKVLPADVSNDAAWIARFQREARLLASLNHPHIATIHGLEQFDGVHALVLELVDGQTLADHLAAWRARAGANTGLPIGEALAIATDIAEALVAAHRVGVIHRDLKPANVMVTASGCKLLDFGLGKSVEKEAPAQQTTSQTATLPRPDLTVRGSFLGTTPYMAPEQIRGEALDHRCDIFAFGIVLYEIIAGRRPFDGAHDADTVAAILHETPPALATLREGMNPLLDRLVFKCLEKDRERRWQSASDIVEALAWVGAAPSNATAPIDATSPAGSATALPRRQVRRWQRGAVAAAAAVIGLAIGAVGGRMFRPDIASVAGSPLGFTIVPAAGTTWGVLPPDPNPAVSPDGRYVAVSARTPDGSGLWLHDLETGDARLLAHSGTTTPVAFWAPDSLSVAFCDDAGVQKISLASQLAELVKSPRCTGGSWNVAGDWLLSTDEGLIRMSASGGPPDPVTRVDRSHGESRHAFGQWLPDGRHFVFLKRGETAAARGIYLQAVGDATARRLVDDYSAPVYVAERPGQGILLFVRKGTLVAQRFDERTLALTGDVLRLGDRVRVGITARSGSFSASQRLLVFRSGAAYQPTRMIWVDRRGRQLGEVGSDAAFRLSPSLSPDERTLIYGRFNEDTNDIELWTTDLRRDVSQPFEKPAFTVDSPRWSPDGRRLAFLSAETGVYAPWTMTLADNSRKPVHGLASSGLYLEWSADSTSVLVNDGGQLRAFPVDGDGPPVIALPHRVQDARVSHDGRWLAYTMSESGQREVYVERFGGGRRLRVSANGGFRPNWRADDRELFFRAPPDRMMSVSVTLGESPAIGDPVELFRANFEPDGSATPGNTDYLVTRDGQRILITIPVTSVKPLTARLNWQSQLPAGPR